MNTSFILLLSIGTFVGMAEVLLGHDIGRPSLDPKKMSENSLKNEAPRSEFFLMTGDKMISLNHKISPRYAEVIFQCARLPQIFLYEIYYKNYNQV